MQRTPEKKDEEVSPDWERIKHFVGGANKPSKHPLVQEAERIKMRKPQHMDEGGIAGDDEINRMLGGMNFGPAGATAQPAPMVPPPIVPRQTIQAGAPVTSPVQASPAPSSPVSDSNYDQQASHILGGITPEKIQQLMATLQQQSNRGQIGAGIAGIGDAISSVGGIKGDHMQNTEDLIQKNKEFGMKLPGEMAAVGKENYGLSHELQTYDPNSPFSKVSQNANRQLLKKMGASDEQISSMPAAAINDVVGHEVTLEDALARIREEGAYRQASLGLQKETLENTKQNQTVEHDLQRQSQELQHPIMTGIKKFLGGGNDSAIPDGRVTVVSPTGQVGHIPHAQLKDALAKGYKQQ